MKKPSHMYIVIAEKIALVGAEAIVFLLTFAEIFLVPFKGYSILGHHELVTQSWPLTLYNTVLFSGIYIF